MINPLLYIYHILTEHDFKTIDRREIHDHIRGTRSIGYALAEAIEFYEYPVEEVVQEKCPCGLERERQVKLEWKLGEIVRTPISEAYIECPKCGYKFGMDP